MAEKYSGDLLRIDPRTEARHRVDLGAAVHGLTVADGRLWTASGAFASSSHGGGTLRVAASELPGHFSGLHDPARAYDLWTRQTLRVVYDGLLAFHYSGADPQVLVPDLAISVPEPTDGGRTYTFNLRPGIRYSTGAEGPSIGPATRRHPRAATGGRETGFLRRHRRRPGVPRHPDVLRPERGGGRGRRGAPVTFHLAAPDPEFLWKLTMLVVPTPPGTPPGHLPRPSPAPARTASPPTAATRHSSSPATPTSASGQLPPNRPASWTPSPGSRSRRPGRGGRRPGEARRTWPSSTPAAGSVRSRSVGSSTVFASQRRAASTAACGRAPATWSSTPPSRRSTTSAPVAPRLRVRPDEGARTTWAVPPSTVPPVS